MVDRDLSNGIFDGQPRAAARLGLDVNSSPHRLGALGYLAQAKPPLIGWRGFLPAEIKTATVVLHDQAQDGGFFREGDFGL